MNDTSMRLPSTVPDYRVTPLRDLRPTVGAPSTALVSAFNACVMPAVSAFMSGIADAPVSAFTSTI